MEGVWIAPVTAQVMMTLSSIGMSPSAGSAGNIFGGPLFISGERHQAAIAPGLAFLQSVRRQLFAPLGFYFTQKRAAPLGMRQRIARDFLIDAFIALHI